MTVIIFLCRKQAAKLTREQPKLTFAFVAHILFFDSLGQLKGDTWAPWFWLTLLPIQSTKQTDHFIPKEFRSVSFLSQFLSHAKKKKKEDSDSAVCSDTFRVLWANWRQTQQAADIFGKGQEVCYLYKRQCWREEQEQDERNGWYPAANDWAKGINMMACWKDSMCTVCLPSRCPKI